MAVKKIFFILFIALATLLFTSCDIDDGVSFNFVPLQIVSVEVPESFDLNRTHQIRVTYLRPNGCTSFQGFDISNPDTTVRNVVVIGAVRADEACSQETAEVEVSFDFIALFTDTYLFRFWTGEDTDGESQYLEVEVPVNATPIN
ncbi:hypothetical protein WIW50_05960 [Flavobacteriaceae bacterium 3-367]|uniref:hypothetical protein n=1 Tax=Eudoraea algarum TaxID=3417568 RepID=UPI00327A38F7